MTGRLTTSDGRVLAYRVVGSGPVLVCHPGGPGFSSAELEDLGGLDVHLTLLLLDPRGTGGSDPPADARAYTVSDYVADLEALRAHLGHEAIDLLGHSHGGVVAMAYAARYPERVRRLVCSSTLARFGLEQQASMEAALAARADEPWYEDARSALAAEEAGDYEDGTELARLVAREMPLFFASFGERERAHAQRLGSEPMCADALRLFNAEELSTFDLRPELPRIRAETLVLVGAEDVVTGPSCADAIAEGIRGSRVLVIQGAGHQTYVEQPEAFCRAVLGFLERSNGP